MTPSSIIAWVAPAMALVLAQGCGRSAPTREEAAAALAEYETSLQGGRYFFDVDTGPVPALCGSCAEAAAKCPSLGKMIELGWLDLRCPDGKPLAALTEEGSRVTKDAERSRSTAAWRTGCTRRAGSWSPWTRWSTRVARQARSTGTGGNRPPLAFGSPRPG